MDNNAHLANILKRTAASLVAIAAVCTIFGTKAVEIERRATLTTPVIAMSPAAPAPIGAP